jgi:hypothetical protein
MVVTSASEASFGEFVNHASSTLAKVKVHVELAAAQFAALLDYFLEVMKDGDKGWW